MPTRIGIYRFKGFGIAGCWISAICIFFMAPPPAAGQQEMIRMGGTLSSTGKYQEPSAMIRNGYSLCARHILGQESVSLSKKD